MSSRYRSWLFVAACVTAISAPRALGQGPPAYLVAVSPVVEREITAGQMFVGTVMPLMTAIVGSAVDGRVVEYPLNEGDRVEPIWSFENSNWPNWKMAPGPRNSRSPQRG
jgi:multidrug efflux pump subunit AcrA (membrane-fusion protein)